MNFSRAVFWINWETVYIKEVNIATLEKSGDMNCDQYSSFHGSHLLQATDSFLKIDIVINSCS